MIDGTPDPPRDPRDPGDDPAPAESYHDDTFPWPPADGESIPGAFVRTWQGASLRPRTFFSRLPDEEPIGAALVFYLILGIVVAGVQLFWSMVLESVDLGRSDTVLDMMGAADAWGPVLGFLLSPLVLLLSLFVAAGVTHVLLRMLAAGIGSYTRTVRVFSYAYAPQLLGVIPFFGQVIGFVWMVGVAIIGLSAAHRTTTARAATAVLIPVVIGMIFVALATFLVTAGALLPTP